MSEQSHLPLVQACEALFAEHGDNYLGQGWTKTKENADIRYRVMLDLILDSDESVSLLDFGCGTGHLLNFILDHHFDGITYSGLDASSRFIEVARSKYPSVTFYLGDLFSGDFELPQFDYIVMNGLFTYKGPLSFNEMVRQWQDLVVAVMAHARVGVAFNATSPYVDWQRDDLFHLPMQLLADVVAGSPCPHFRIRHDYGLYESTVYAYRSPIGV